MQRVSVTFPAAAMALLSCLALLACGGSGSGRTLASSTSVEPSKLVRDADEDYDDPGGGYYDLDDNPILRFGHPAAPAEAAAVARTVASFYSDAAAKNGAAACPLLFSVVAESLPEQYESVSGSKTAYGRTCASVLSRVFAQGHRVYAERHATLQVTAVRVEGEQGYALLRFAEKGARDEHLHLRREGSNWKLHQFKDEGLP